MEYVKLGRSGLEVSKVSLGTMGFGVPERGNTPWSLNEEQSRPIIKKKHSNGASTFSVPPICIPTEQVKKFSDVP